MHWHFMQQLGVYATAEVGGRKYTPKFRSPKSLSLSGNYFRNRCKSAVAVAGSAACPPVCDLSCPSDNCGDRYSPSDNCGDLLLHRITVAIVILHRICHQYDRLHVRALLELQRRSPI